MEKTKKLKISGEEFLSQLFETNRMLDIDDLDQIRTRYNAGFYVLGAQFVWRKFRLLVKEFITENLKPGLINYMTFTNNESRPSPFAIYDFEMLFMFGIISKKEKFEIMKVLRSSQQFENPFYQMSKASFENLLELCFDTFFSKDKEKLVRDYYEMKGKILNTTIAEDENLLKYLASKNYRLFTTAIRTLMYYYEQDPSNQMIENNLMFLVGHFWSRMTYNDKLFLGYLVTTDKKPDHVKQMAKKLLSQGDELNFMSDVKNIDEIVQILQQAKCAYYGYKGGGIILDALSDLSKIEVPIKYCSMYLSVLFMAAFGADDEQIDMQSSMVKLMLNKIDVVQYKYYFDFCMRYDEQVLLMLATNKYARTLFAEFIRTLDPKALDTTDKRVANLLLSSITGDYKDVAKRAKEML